MKAVLSWLDHRTGYKAIVHDALYEIIPGGARWRYIWGSALMFAISAQFITGFVLWMAYSANAQGAWESVYYIQNVMIGGWILRGIHHYMAQVTMVLLVVHLLQVIIAGAYRAPREVNFWFGLALLKICLGLSLTGYLLPWDQKGYWATKVATSIASITPVVGPSLQRFMIGGAEYGHHTLTRFFALHAGLLPAALIAVIVGHVYLFRRHGVTVTDPERGKDETFWPEQVFRDSVASIVVMAVVLGIVFWMDGAHLGAPADPTEPYAAARPEWYFLFLFQWLKYFPAGWEVFGAMIVPGMVATAVVAMPFIAKWKHGHRFNLAMIAFLLLGIGVLTRLAYTQDAADEGYVTAKAQSDASAHRISELASSPTGIPPMGALALMRMDPLTQGPKIFATSCASCHTFDGHDGLGVEATEDVTASDLQGFGSREWVTGLLDPDDIRSDAYFGATDHRRGAMVRFVTRKMQGLEGTAEQLPGVIAALSAEAQLESQTGMDEADQALIAAGRGFMSEEEGLDCTECHTYRGLGEEDPDGPTLDGWASRDWMIGMIRNPTHETYYGEDNDGMPAFLDEGLLTDEEIGLVVDWLRGEWYRAEGS